MAILPRDRALDTAPSEEERAHGLGNASDHGRVKLRAVAARHAGSSSRRSRRSSRAGTRSRIVHGNHDVEFHWDGVKQRDCATWLGRAAPRR